MFIAVNYSTKWVEAQLVATVTKQRAIDFLQKNLIMRYGPARSITMQNGRQFISKSTEEYCIWLEITIYNTSVFRSQTNL